MRHTHTKHHVLIVALVAVLVLGVGASPALASAPPSLQFVVNEQRDAYGPYGHDVLYVYPTRLVAEANLSVNGLDTKWRAEYATSESALEEGSGIVASSGEKTPKGAVGNGGENMSFGPPDPGVENVYIGVLHHLTPEMHYYARFIAENSAGKAVLPFEFTTPPAAKPEVAEINPNASDERTSLQVGATSPTTAAFKLQLETNGAPTEYSFGYSESPTGPFTICTSSGSVSEIEDFAELHGQCSGLNPETTYYMRLLATNAKGVTEQAEYSGICEGSHCEYTSFTTPTARPVASYAGFRNVTATSAHVSAGLVPHQSETHWHFEYAPSALGPWSAVPGAAGTISQAEAEAIPGTDGPVVGGVLAGLSPNSHYYVRLFAENALGEGQNSFGEPILTSTREIRSFTTDAPPTVATLAVHALQGEALRVIGSVDPNNEPLSAEQTVTIEGAPTGGTFTLTFAGKTTAPIPYNADQFTVAGILTNALKESVQIGVEGPDGGPYTLYFGNAGKRFGGGVAQPAVEANGSGLASGSVKVAIAQQGGPVYDTRYHFQYMSQRAFEAQGGFAGSGVRETPAADAGSGTETHFFAADLSALTPGESYRYRIFASSGFPGNPQVAGNERTLLVPAPPAPEQAVACPNEALRTGRSANLPDCRGYEQLTPVDKQGARQPFNYGLVAGGGAVVGEDGDHVMLDAEGVTWNSGPTGGQSPFFFSRGQDGVWRMTAATVQPETGVYNPFAQLLDPDLSAFGFSSSFETAPGVGSKGIEYRVGPPGGPYVTVASVPVKQAGLGWVGASHDFSRLLLDVGDHSLLGRSTGTKRGDDLYEYAGGELRQVNVTGPAPGATIGKCGANVVKGDEAAGTVSSARAVSTDGSRVFFEAVPSAECSEPTHLYMRLDGESTVDIGAYHFLAANATGDELLLEKDSGETHEILSYDTESATVKSLFSVHRQTVFEVSEDLSTIYFTSPEQLSDEAPPMIVDGTEGEAAQPYTSYIYRYDVPAGTLSFIDAGYQVELAGSSPDGRDLYLKAEALEGVPGGQQSPGRNNLSPQVYRYDSVEDVVQCMSCASGFDPEPKLISVFGDLGGNGGIRESRTGYPKPQFASANGDYVFFDTPSALVPADVDGEVAPETAEIGSVNPSGDFSVSSDVYEWRRSGVDGCAQLQGCLALITNGRGGYLNLFLGTDESGRDAFVYTDSQLVSQDNDTAGDIYDARIGGGTPPPSPRPVECEGDACSTPPSAPNDATPSSLTFSGEGNAVPETAQHEKKPKAKAKPKTKGTCKAKVRSTCKATKAKKGKKARTRRVGRAGANRRVK